MRTVLRTLLRTVRRTRTRSLLRGGVRDALVVPVLGLLTLAAAPSPAPGGGTTYGEGFQDGRTVGVQLTNSSITLSGNGLGGKAGGYRIPRPCWYEPGKSAEDMLQAQKDQEAFWRRSGQGTSAEDWQKFLKQYQDKVGQDGRWWSPAYNAADPDGYSCWNQLQGAVWVPPGTTPPGGITMQELLQIARAALTVPEPVIKLSPDVKSYVNLQTWVWLDDPGATTRSVTATLPGVMSATVTATLKGIEIKSGTSDDRADVFTGCGTTGHPYTKGGDFTCGVVYKRASIDQPRKVYTLTVTADWPVTGAGNGAGAVEPFAYDPVRASATRDVPVGEIQSIVRP